MVPLLNFTNSLIFDREIAAKEKAANLLACGYPAILTKSSRLGKSFHLYPLAGFSAESFICFLLCCSTA
jgi:hypothetical protein